MRFDRCEYLARLVAGAVCLSLLVTGSTGLARTFGDDALTSPRSIVREQDRRYSSIGFVECRLADGRSYRSSGFLLGSRTTMLASRQALGGLTSSTRGIACRADFHAADGTLRDSVAIGRMIPARGAAQGDLAVFTLTRPSAYAQEIAGYLHGGTPARFDRQPVQMVTMVAWQGGLRKVRSGGIAYTSGADVAGSRNTPGRGAMATDYDSVSASRGSPVFDTSGKVIGIHSGSHCPMGGTAFDRNRCFNEFTIIGDSEHELIVAAAKR